MAASRARYFAALALGAGAPLGVAVPDVAPLAEGAPEVVAEPVPDVVAEPVPDVVATSVPLDDAVAPLEVEGLLVVLGLLLELVVVASPPQAASADRAAITSPHEMALRMVPFSLSGAAERRASHDERAPRAGGWP